MKLKNACIIIILILFSGFAATQALTAPNSVEITKENKEFSIKILNDSNQSQFVGIELISPLNYEISPTPLSIPAFASQTFKIKVFPSKNQSNETIKSTLIAKLGNNTVQKRIIFEIKDFSTKQKNNTDSNFLIGFIIMPNFEKINWEQIIDIILIIIIIILLIALIARLIARNARKKASEEFK